MVKNLERLVKCLLYENCKRSKQLIQLMYSFHSSAPTTCQGDSGGPMVMRDISDSPWYQMGIVSFGTDNTCKRATRFYTRVDAYIPWIESKMRP